MSVTVPIDSADRRGRDRARRASPGVGMLVVTRGPNSGSKFALDEPLVTAGRHPDSVIFLDDITVSRRHAEVRQTDGRLRGRRRRLAERHLPQPRAGRVRTAHRRRRAPDRHVQAALPRGSAVTVRHGGPLPPVHRRGPQPAAGRLPRRHDLQDPLPREPGPARPGAHALRLPEVLRGRHRAAAVDPAPPARPLPAAQGDEGPPRGGGRRRPRRAARRTPGAPTKSGTPSLFEDPGEERAATRPPSAEAPTARRPRRRPRAPRRAVRSGRAARPAPTMPALPVRPSVNPLDAGPTGVSFTLDGARRRQRPHGRRARRARPLRAPRRPLGGRRHLLRRRRPDRRPHRGRRSCASASRPATCACTRWRPSGRPGSWSRS